MRELERDDLPSPLNAALVIVGRGRVGRSLAAAAESAGVEVKLAASDELTQCRGAAVLLCVPDEAIAKVAARVAAEDPALVGHVSGATTLEALAAAADRGASTFSLHPLQTFPDGESPIEGTPAAIAGSDAEGLGYARSLAETLGMRPFEVSEEYRAAYHAAAAIAS
ncbi:MAG TPA: DUF2520 domain-containing protein, partial [Solirubrobacterales bacterium]|nr:DUF2520 domain-containing protein [Solirubrobacterales bacterium]